MRTAALFIKLAIVLTVFVAIAVNTSVTTAEAAQTNCVGTVIDGDCYVEASSSSYVPCSNGYLSSGDVCRVLGDLSGVFVCPAGPAGTVVTVHHVIIKGTQYVESCTYARLLDCPVGTTAFDGRCWEKTEFSPDPVTETTATPVPPTKRGHISLGYTVSCSGEGLARVALGAPVLTDGAAVSLITVNGSPTVAADLPGGSPVVVEVTPIRTGDSVFVTGPSVAPVCQTTQPEPTSAPSTRPSSPTSLAVTPLSPTPTPTVDATPEATATVAPSATATPLPEDQINSASEAPTVVPTAPPLPAAASNTSPDCATNEAFVTGRCLAPCPSSEASTAETPPQVCYAVEVSSPSAAAEIASAASPIAPAPAANNTVVLLLATLGGVLLGALALVGGITIARQQSS